VEVASIGTQSDADRDRRRTELLQVVMAEHSALLSLRSQVGSELAFRAGLYFAALSSSVVALGFVSQRGQSLTLFALIILPVIFFLGLFTYGRMLQNAVQFMIAGHSIDRIRRFYREVDPAQRELFHEIHPNDSGLMALGIFNLKWQQFLAATTMVAIVDAAVAGTASATLVASVLTIPTWAVAAFGVFVALCVTAAFMVHQLKTWGRVAAALPGLNRPRTITSPSKRTAEHQAD
jgi:hypothetical protein